MVKMGSKRQLTLLKKELEKEKTEKETDSLAEDASYNSEEEPNSPADKSPDHKTSSPTFKPQVQIKRS